jgi:molybdate transport system substrate-binding protein
MKKLIALMMAAMMVLGLASCGSSDTSADTTETATVETEAAETAAAETEAAETPAAETEAAEAEAEVLAETTIYVDIAASMSSSFEDIVALYATYQPNVTVALNAGSSGTLLKQIEESNGIGHDIFFSAGKKQVKTLDEEDGLVVEGSTVELLQHALCLVTGNNSGTTVTGWDDISNAANMALCDGTVPVGKYSREAFVTLGILEGQDDNSAYTSDEISAAFGGIEINECADVAATAQAVAEGSNEIGTIYYTDWYDYEDQLTILAQDDGTLTGAIIYPVCQVNNADADEAELAATADFLAFLQTDEVLAIFEDHCFVINQ